MFVAERLAQRRKKDGASTAMVGLLSSIGGWHGGFKLLHLLTVHVNAVRLNAAPLVEFVVFDFCDLFKL